MNQVIHTAQKPSSYVPQIHQEFGFFFIFDPEKYEWAMNITYRQRDQVFIIYIISLPKLQQMFHTDRAGILYKDWSQIELYKIVTEQAYYPIRFQPFNPNDHVPCDLQNFQLWLARRPD